jgi:hypothetical protein
MLSETSVRIFQEPRRTFSRLADTPFDPAWRFAWAWSMLAQLPLFAATVPTVGGLIFMPIGAAASVTLAIVIQATFHYLATRALGGRAHWKLSARAVAYATPWWKLATSLVMLLTIFVPLSSAVTLVATSIVGDLFMLWVFYLVGRDRQGLLPLSAWMAAAVGASSASVFKVVFVAVTTLVSHERGLDFFGAH